MKKVILDLKKSKNASLAVSEKGKRAAWINKKRAELLKLSKNLRKILISIHAEKEVLKSMDAIIKRIS